MLGSLIQQLVVPNFEFMAEVIADFAGVATPVFQGIADVVISLVIPAMRSFQDAMYEVLRTIKEVTFGLLDFTGNTPKYDKGDSRALPFGLPAIPRASRTSASVRHWRR